MLALVLLAHEISLEGTTTTTVLNLTPSARVINHLQIGCSVKALDACISTKRLLLFLVHIRCLSEYNIYVHENGETCKRRGKLTD